MAAAFMGTKTIYMLRGYDWFIKGKAVLTVNLLVVLCSLCHQWLKYSQQIVQEEQWQEQKRKPLLSALVQSFY